MKIIKDYNWFTSRLLKRFLSYVKIHTTSDRHKKKTPSTPGQLVLAIQLADELKALGIKQVEIDENGFLYAFIEPTSDHPGKEECTIGFIAHLDTSWEVPGKNVKPQLHHNFDGKRLRLNESLYLNPWEYPQLKKYKTDTIITSDGTTLLGADNKAGIAEIITAVEYLINHPQIKHNPIELLFTPDEETGLGIEKYPLKKIKSKYCYTVDGGEEGTIEAECFEAYSLKISFMGKSIHLGSARGKLVNALSMAAKFISLLPQNESPEATDGRYGFYCPIELNGNIEQAKLEIFIRDFNEEKCKARIKAVNNYLKAIASTFTGGKTKLKIKKQYSNMWPYIKEYPRLITLLEKAVSLSGCIPVKKYIRGGTDGAKMAEKGIPTPNIFTGGFNFHSRLEWIPLSAMVKATKTLIYLIKLWNYY